MTGWSHAVADLEAALAVMTRSLEARDWPALEELSWNPPAVDGPAGDGAPASLAAAAAEVAALRQRVAAELARIEADVADLVERRRAARAYLRTAPPAT